MVEHQRSLLLNIAAALSRHWIMQKVFSVFEGRILHCLLKKIQRPWKMAS